MSVENVFTPKTINPVDPKNTAEKREGDKGYWQQKAEEARARHDYMEYEHAIKMMEGQPPETPFKVTGEFNLGKVDFQEQQRKAQEVADKARQETSKELKEERERATKAEQNLYTERIENLRHDFEHQMGELNKTIEKLLTAGRRDERPIYEQFKEQFTAAQTFAKELGFEKTSGGQDPMVTLELKKMEYQQAREDREFKWKMRQDEKQFQLDIQKMNDDREYHRAQLDQQAKKDQIFASLPQQIGAAFARGVLDNEGGAPPGGTIQRQQAPAKPYHLEAPEGESGEIDCPTCQAKVGIGPDTTSAECAWCRSKFTITRIPATGTPGEPVPAELKEE